MLLSLEYFVFVRTFQNIADLKETLFWFSFLRFLRAECKVERKEISEFLYYFLVLCFCLFVLGKSPSAIALHTWSIYFGQYLPVQKVKTVSVV